MTRMSLTTDSGGCVTLAYDDAFGERVERRFVCRDAAGSYVREIMPDGSTRQPCEGLARTGSTLMCDSRAELPDVIRREYQRARRNGWILL